MLICSLGDLALDVIVRLRQPLAAGADANFSITVEPGGQAANAAAWVAALGARSRWIGKRAADDGGRLAAEKLAAYGVELCGPVVETGGGVIVSLVDPAGERTMCPTAAPRSTSSPTRSTRPGSPVPTGCTCPGMRCSPSRCARQHIARSRSPAMPKPV